MTYIDLFSKAKFTVPGISHNTQQGGRTEVTTVLRKTISQKEFHPSLAVVLFLRIYAPEIMAEYPVVNSKESIKPLKIRLPAIKPIDIVLRRRGVTKPYKILTVHHSNNKAWHSPFNVCSSILPRPV